MREFRPSGSVEGVVSNHDPYSDSLRMTVKAWLVRDTTLGLVKKVWIKNAATG